MNKDFANEIENVVHWLEDLRCPHRAKIIQSMRDYIIQLECANKTLTEDEVERLDTLLMDSGVAAFTLPYVRNSGSIAVFRRELTMRLLAAGVTFNPVRKIAPLPHPVEELMGDMTLILLNETMDDKDKINKIKEMHISALEQMINQQSKLIEDKVEQKLIEPISTPSFEDPPQGSGIRRIEANLPLPKGWKSLFWINYVADELGWSDPNDGRLAERYTAFRAGFRRGVNLQPGWQWGDWVNWVESDECPQEAKEILSRILVGIWNAARKLRDE